LKQKNKKKNWYSKYQWIMDAKNRHYIIRNHICSLCDYSCIWIYTCM